MRRVIGWVLLATSAILTFGGGIVAAYLGPDSAVELGDRRVTTETAAVVAGTSAFARVGPTLVLTVEPRDNATIFAGVAQEIDVRSFLGAVKHEVADTVEVPLAFSTRAVGDGTDPLPEPRLLDIWAAVSTGADRQRLTWQTTDGDWNLVLMRTDGAAGVDAEISAAFEFGDAFSYALAAVSWGLCLGAAAVYLLRRPARSELVAGDVDLWSNVEPSEAADVTEVLTRGGRS